jgi:hypothetical protein
LLFERAAAGFLAAAIAGLFALAPVLGVAGFVLGVRLFALAAGAFRLNWPLSATCAVTSSCLFAERGTSSVEPALITTDLAGMLLISLSAG